MNNERNKIKELNSCLNSYNFVEMFNILKELELVLQKNVAFDEDLLEKEKPLIYVKINEEIKESIVSAQYHYNIYMRTSPEWKPLKVYLDDKRTTPNGYFRVFWPSDVIRLLEEFEVQELSLDHDLGDDVKGTGYDAVCYVEEQAYFNKDFKIPYIKVHSDNASAKYKMELGIKNIMSRKNV